VDPEGGVGLMREYDRVLRGFRLRQRVVPHRQDKARNTPAGSRSIRFSSTSAGPWGLRSPRSQCFRVATLPVPQGRHRHAKARSELRLGEPQAASQAPKPGTAIFSGAKPGTAIFCQLGQPYRRLDGRDFVLQRIKLTRG